MAKEFYASVSWRWPFLALAETLRDAANQRQVFDWLLRLAINPGSAVARLFGEIDAQSEQSLIVKIFRGGVLRTRGIFTGLHWFLPKCRSDTDGNSDDISNNEGKGNPSCHPINTISSDYRNNIGSFRKERFADGKKNRGFAINCHWEQNRQKQQYHWDADNR